MTQPTRCGVGFEVNVGDLEKETHFYQEADDVTTRLHTFRDAVNAQNEEFNLLLDYYMRHRGKIDVFHKPMCGREQANLGTANESWYYLDGKGNKIWVRSLSLATAAENRGKKTGSFEEAQNADGRRIVVTVPEIKHHCGFPSDYDRRCLEYEMFREGQTCRPATASHRSGRSSEAAQKELRPTTSNVQRYIEGQMSLRHSIKNAIIRGETVVSRPPTTVEEAEERMRELKEEEQRLCKEIFC